MSQDYWDSAVGISCSAYGNNPSRWSSSLGALGATALQNAAQQSAYAQQAALQQAMQRPLNWDDLVNVKPGGIVRVDELRKTQPPQQPQPKEQSMFGEIAKDIKTFILEYRAVLYFIAIALILDEFIFKGAFRARLQGVADQIVKKVESKVADA